MPIAAILYPGSRCSRQGFFVFGKWMPRSLWTDLAVATLGALVIGAAVWFAVPTSRLPPKAAVELRPLHQAIIDTGGGDVSVAVAEFLPDSFDEAVTVLAEAAALGQRFPRPVRIYALLDIDAASVVAFGEDRPNFTLRYIVKHHLRLTRSEAVAGTCSELVFGFSPRGKRRQLPVYLFRSPDGTVRVHASTASKKCW